LEECSFLKKRTKRLLGLRWFPLIRPWPVSFRRWRIKSLLVLFFRKEQSYCGSALRAAYLRIALVWRAMADRAAQDFRGLTVVVLDHYFDSEGISPGEGSGSKSRMGK
jgi:hypothetical protein